MRFTVFKEVQFAASHFLREYHGKCETLHGHNYRVRVYVGADELDHEGMVVDFVLLRNLLREVVDEQLDHRHLNEIAPFDVLNPTAEQIAQWIAEEVATRLDDSRVRVTECHIWETDTNCAVFRR
jgi:6-pyruvoyltetrahydropterin/6-carboxytetrahydropterin synthase